METFTYKDDKFSIRPQAPPGGETHFNISDASYGNKNIHHKYKRNNHPYNDINPPPNHVKKEEVIESTPNGADPVTGNRPSIKLRAPPGGFSSLDYYADENGQIIQGECCSEPSTEQELNSEGKSADHETKPEEKLEQKQEIRDNNDAKPNDDPFDKSNDQEFKRKPFRPVYTPQAPPGGKSSISFGYDDEPVNKPKPQPKPNPEFSSSSSEDYKPVYKPQAPPGGRSSISFTDEPVNNPPKQKSKPNPEFQESFFSSKEETPSVRRNSHTKQNNESTFGSSIFNSNENDNKYKPYYAPQAPPGGKDSISFGYDDSSNANENRTTGRRRNYENDHFKGSDFTKEENNNTPYKPYYAPQAPPGGKDSISLGFGESSSASTTENRTTGRRRNYENDHFKGSDFTKEENNNTPYKPYYAPQAPPGGKDSISLGFDESSSASTTENRSTGRRRNYDNDHFKGSDFTKEENNNTPYKPYYAPQAPPGGKDSISLGYDNSNDNNNNNNTTTSFSGRRRNYNSDHFKSSFGFNY